MALIPALLMGLCALYLPLPLQGEEIRGIGADGLPAGIGNRAIQLQQWVTCGNCWPALPAEPDRHEMGLFRNTMGQKTPLLVY